MPNAPKRYMPHGREPRTKRENQWSSRQGESRGWYFLKAWKALRLAQLQKEPLCRECRKTGRVTAASHVDHIIPHRGDYTKFHDPEGLQSLCAECHSRKTATHDGGFGNKQ